ncbi:MAG TPA: glutaredoxin family protein [Rhodocyclaceae bacterium]|nr:glutaredoxin family protein [Rhodocyclaceae bacterium]
MKHAVLLALLALTCTVQAQTTYRWVDNEGKVHYTDRAPLPGEARNVEQKRSALLGADQTASYALRKAMADYPVTLYTQTTCGDVCNDGRDHLTRRGIPFSSKTISSEADAAALRTLVGEGALVVPVLQVGSKATKGYLSSDWDSLLDAAGYPKASAQPGAAR